jgi:hypothetical protein
MQKPEKLVFGSPSLEFYCCLIIAAVALASTSFAQPRGIADEVQILDVIDEMGKPISNDDVRSILEAVATGRVQALAEKTRELDERYLAENARAPLRETANVVVEMSSPVLDRLLAFVRQECAKPIPDWTLLEPLTRCLGCVQDDSRVVDISQILLSLEMKSPRNESHVASLMNAIGILAQQESESSILTLKECTQLGSTTSQHILPDSRILKTADGRPSTTAIELAQYAVMCVIIHARPSVAKTFLLEVANQAVTDANHPLRDSIEEYCRQIEIVERGQDPFVGVPFNRLDDLEPVGE